MVGPKPQIEKVVQHFLRFGFARRSCKVSSHERRCATLRFSVARALKMDTRDEQFVCFKTKHIVLLKIIITNRDPLSFFQQEAHWGTPAHRASVFVASDCNIAFLNLGVTQVASEESEKCLFKTINIS